MKNREKTNIRQVLPKTVAQSTVPVRMRFPSFILLMLLVFILSGLSCVCLAQAIETHETSDTVADTVVAANPPHPAGEPAPIRAVTVVGFIIPPEKTGPAFSPRHVDGMGLRGPVNSDADPETGRTDLFMLVAGEPLVQVDAGLFGMPALPFTITGYSADIAAVDTPSTITTTLRIKNTGIAPLTGITINSSFLESLSGPGRKERDTPAPHGSRRMERSQDGQTWTLAAEPAPDGGKAPEAVLYVGETWIFTGEFAVTQKMIDGNGVNTENQIDGNGHIDNAVTVSFAETEPRTAVASIPVIQNPGFAVIQTPDSAFIDAPKTINYTITIENTGNMSLTGILITAPLLNELNGPEGDVKNPGVLDVDEIWTYTGTYAAAREVIDGAGVNTYNIISNSGNIDSTVMVRFAEADAPQTAFAAVATKLTVSGDIFEKKYRHLHAFISAKRSYTTNFYRTDNNAESCWATFVTPGVWATYPSEMKRSVEIVTANASPGGLAFEPFNPIDFNKFQAYILYSPQFERYRGQKNKAVGDPDTGVDIIDDDDIDRADDRIDDFIGNNALNRTTHRVDAMLHYHSGNKLSVRAIDQYKISYDTFSERAFWTDDKYKSNMFHIAGTFDPTARLQLRLDYGNFHLNYRDDANRDDDRRDHSWAAYLFFRLTAKTSVFLEYDYADIGYKTSPRDSYEHRYFGGIRWEMTGKSSGQIKGGYGKKRMNYPDMIDTDVSLAGATTDNWLAAIQFDHNFTERINLTFNAYRRYDEVLEHRYNYGNLDNFYADYILAHFGGFRLSWNIFSDITLNLDTSLFHDRFKGSRLSDRDGKPAERKDLDFALSPSISIDLFKHLSISGAYIYTDHDSNYPTHDYVDHTFFISASLSI